jgi:hypothetical protein
MLKLFNDRITEFEEQKSYQNCTSIRTATICGSVRGFSLIEESVFIYKENLQFKIVIQILTELQICFPIAY